MVLVEFVWRIRSLGLSHQTVSDPGFLTGLILYPSSLVFLKPASLWTYELDLGGPLMFSRLFPLSKNNFLIASPIMSLSDSCFSLRFHLLLFCISQYMHTSIYTANNLNHHEMMCLVRRLFLDAVSDYY